MKEVAKNKTKSNHIKRLVLLGIIILMAIGLFVSSSLVYSSMLRPVDRSNTSDIRVVIPQGASIDDVSDILTENNLIKNKRIFRSYASRHSNGPRKIQAGSYTFNKTMSGTQIFGLLLNGGNAEGDVIIPEGRNLKEIAQILEENNICSAQSFIEEAGNVDYYKQGHPILSSIPDKPERNLEGYLFPDTYHFLENSEPREVINTMLKRTEEVLDVGKRQEIEAQGKTVDEIIIMGSIVELETKRAEDRTNAASVFYNRMKAEMPLQSDITIDYARGFKVPVLTEEETKFESPYNTYIHLGLPIGPICSPGISAIEAALHPADTKYLYFVADMETGKLYFNETHEGHEADVKKYMP
ncbi:MAG: endolytic transglycosylase MltG [Eubacteriaceae bacterium]|jgi:UPF0755 protein|nr:endolytic transglycosylase MltG [Eubacteriaceae bacterium]